MYVVCLGVSICMKFGLYINNLFSLYSDIEDQESNSSYRYLKFKLVAVTTAFLYISLGTLNKFIFKRFYILTLIFFSLFFCLGLYTCVFDVSSLLSQNTKLYYKILYIKEIEKTMKLESL